MKRPMFKDATGREWSPVVTALTALKFEDQTGKNLFAPATLQALVKFESFAMLLRLAFLACEREALKRDIGFDQFCESIQDDLLMRELFGQTIVAVTLYLKSQPKVAETLQAALAEMNAANATNIQ